MNFIVETPRRVTGAKPWSTSQQANEALVKVILSRNLPVVRSPASPVEFGKDLNPPKSGSAPRVTLFDGFTNAAISARFKTDDSRIAALVYCSAGMIGGQLSNPGGTHFAQEESTLVENPLIFSSLDQRLEEVHHCVRTEYPVYTFEQAKAELGEKKDILTPAYGFLIDNVIPLQLDGSRVNSNPFYSNFDLNGEEIYTKGDENYTSPYISYIMQAALHLGLTNEDENTNFMFKTNKFITNTGDCRKIRALATRCANQLDKTFLEKLKNIPKEEGFSSSNDAFNAFSTHLQTRLGLRYAMKTLLFFDVDFNTIQTDHDNIKKSTQDLFEIYDKNHKQIEENYLNVVRIQLMNQINLTKLFNKNVIIIGVFGCGVYNNNWSQIAQVYADVISKYGGHLKEVVVCNKLNPENRKGMEEFTQFIAKAISKV